MPVIELGRRPDLLRVLLLPGAGFTTQIKLTGEDVFEEHPILLFPLQATTWAAELLDPQTAVFTITATQVDLLIGRAGDGRDATLFYGETPWSTGKWETLDMGGRSAIRASSVFEVGVNRPRMEVDNLPAVIRTIREPALEHIQETPLASWVIPHDLGRVPIVDVYIDNELVETDVDSTANVTTISFPIPYAGVAALF